MSYYFNKLLKVNFICLATSCLIVSCTTLNNSVENQTTYLYEILETHKDAIDEERLAHKKYGYKSKTHVLAERKKAAINKENVGKIEQFLQRYGHPTVKLHGSKLADLPFTIFNDNPKSKKIILRNLNYINIASQKKAISDRTYIYYLQSLHSSIFKNRLRLKTPHTEKEELDSLWAKLNIDSLLNKYN